MEVVQGSNRRTGKVRQGRAASSEVHIEQVADANGRVSVLGGRQSGGGRTAQGPSHLRGGATVGGLPSTTLSG